MRIFQNMFRTNVQQQNTVQNSGKQQVAPGFLQSHGIKPSKVMQQAVERLNARGTQVGSQELKQIDNFLRNAEGSDESKLQTVEIAAEKGVELTQENLNAVHSALNDTANAQEVVESLSDDQINKADWEKVMKGLGIPDSVIQEIKADVAKGKDPVEAIADKLAEKLGPGSTVSVTAKMTTITVKDGDKVITVQQMSVVLTATFKQGVPEALQKMLGMEATIDQVQSLLDLADQVLAGSLSIDDFAAMLIEAVENMEDNLVETLGQSEAGQTQPIAGQGSNQVDPAPAEVSLTGAEGTPTPTDAEGISQADMADLLDQLDEAIEDVVDRLGADGSSFAELAATAMGTPPVRMFLVEEVTAKMESVRIEFVDMQRNVLSNLNQALDQMEGGSRQEMAEAVDKAIELLDKTIMKSDVPLYTDMKLEKQLITDSSRLQEARKWMAAGDLGKAKAIVMEVKQHIEMAVFKPSDQKVKVFAAGQLATAMDMQPGAQVVAGQGASARGIMEILSNMGLNHEAEVSEKLQGNKNNLMDTDVKDNLKVVLMKMIEDEDPSSRGAVSGASKALGNLIGQQLLNRLDQKSDTQTLFFNIPLQVQQEVKDMKLYVNSRKNGDKMDWENSTLYFSIELKEYGETGIRIQARDRQLTLTVKNDNGGLESVMSPLLDGLKKEFEDIGYQSGPVHFLPLNENEVAHVNHFDMAKRAPIQASQKPLTNEEGFELKI